MDYHRQCLDSLCRFCGGRVIKAKWKRNHAYKVSNYQQITEAKFNIDLSQDLPDVHPIFLCTKCYCQIIIVKNNVNEQKSWSPKNDWCAHKRNADCYTCTLFQSSARPGRPKKRKAGGRPLSTPASHFSQLYDFHSTPTPITKCYISTGFQVDPCHTFLICSVCNCVVACPVETHCGHLFCVDCLTSLFCKVSINCPLCNVNVHFKQTNKPFAYINALIDNLHLQCTHCHSSIHHTKTSIHLCRQRTNDHTYSKNPITVQLTSRQKQEVAMSYLKSQCAQSQDGISATFGIPGRGKPIKTTIIPASRVSSKDCSSSTKRKRSTVMAKMRKRISLGEEKAQQRHEIQSSGGLPEILGPAGISIPVKDILQLKSFFGFSWSKLRRLKRWLKERDVSTGNERGVRLLQDKIIGNNLDGVYVPMQFCSDVTQTLVIKETPLIHVKNLTSLVFDLLDQYDELDELTWHNGCIPSDELWIKIGGDKGGGTFKLMIQLANVSRPNSVANTRVVLLYPGGDSSFNLDVALSCFTPQVKELSSSTWRGKKIKIFAFGDYEYLTRMYGLSGPNGHHCCLYCNISKKEMATPPMKRPATRLRTLQTLHDSLEMFKQQGIPKEANNVVREPFFTIPIERVCPPGLHMSLGIHLKHYVSLTKSSHLLDLKIAQHLANSAEEKEAANQAFKNQVEKLVLQAKAEELGQDMKDLIEQHTMAALLYPENEPPAAILEMAEEKKKEKIKMEKDISKLPDLPFGAGPISMRLEEVLQGMQVCRQAFHGRVFVGNHVHRSLQPHNVDKITESLLQTVETVCPTSELLKAEAGATGRKYNQLFHLFGACHRGMSSGSFLDDEGITHLEEDIRSYMEFYRQNFPSETVTPKQHILENHTIPWLRQWKASLGLLGEQGGESVHCQVNNISRDLRGYHDALKLSLQSVKTQWVQSSPNTYHDHTKELQSKRK